MQATNYTTGNPYSVNNSETLFSAGFTSSQWATYRQFHKAGYQVRKGEKGTKLVRVIEREDKHGNIKKTIRSFTVFNLEQVESSAQQAA